MSTFFEPVRELKKLDLNKPVKSCGQDHPSAIKRGPLHEKQEVVGKPRNRLGGAWFVYLARCSDDSLYCGATIDLERRRKHITEGQVRGIRVQDAP